MRSSINLSAGKDVSFHFYPKERRNAISEARYSPLAVELWELLCEWASFSRLPASFGTSSEDIGVFSASLDLDVVNEMTHADVLVEPLLSGELCPPRQARLSPSARNIPGFQMGLASDTPAPHADTSESSTEIPPRPRFLTSF